MPKEIYIWKDKVDSNQCFIGIRSRRGEFVACMSTTLDGIFDCLGGTLADLIEKSPSGKPILFNAVFAPERS